MQALYSHNLNADPLLSNQKKKLLQSTHTVYSIFLYIIYTFKESALYSHEYLKISKERYIKDDNLIVDTSITENPLMQHFINDEDLQAAFKKAKVAIMMDEDLPGKLFRAMKDREEYKAYTLLEKKTEEDERKILRVFFKKVLLKSELLSSQLEESFITWEDDRNTVINMVIATINEFYKHQKQNFEKSMPQKDWEEIDKFAIDLYVNTVNKKAELDELIEPTLENWEMDRINIVDLILVRMALAELLYFPTVPIKVTLNEYVEISKVYSTPKSKEFINGILDRLMKELKDKNKINKTGRGLVE